MNMKALTGCAGWAAVLVTASAMVPLFGSLIPLPFLYYSTKLGLKEGIKIAALSFVFAGLIGIPVKIPYIFILSGIEFGLTGLLLSVLFRIRISAGQIIFSGTLFMVVLSGVVLVLAGILKGTGPLEIIGDYLHTQLEAGLAAYEVSPEDAANIETYVRMIFPALIILDKAFAVWLNMIVARPLFRVANLRYPVFVPMSRWKAPDKLVWGVIFSGFVLVLFTGVVRSLALNVFIVLMAVYLFHGLAIVLFYFNKYQLHPVAKAGVLFLVFIQPYCWLLLAVAGLFDQWVDFRRFSKEKAE